MLDINRQTDRSNMIWKLVDRSDGAENAAIDWSFSLGDRVKIRLVNEMGSDHPMPHPFHVHGAGRFLVMAKDGVPESATLTLRLGPGMGEDLRFGAWRAAIPAELDSEGAFEAGVETLRIAMIFTFTGVMIAEMYASRTGIGHMIAGWGENFQMAQLLGGVIILSVVAILFNEAVRHIELRFDQGRQPLLTSNDMTRATDVRELRDAF